MSWEEAAVGAGEDKDGAASVLEKPEANVELLLNGSDGFLFPLPLDGGEQSARALNCKGKSGRKSNFSPEEDAQLEQLVNKHGEAKWSLIASIMKKWNRKQLRERYINFIKGRGTAANFTPAEDSTILEHIKKHGHVWKQIAAKLPGRSPIAVKNRYYKVFLKKASSLSVSYKDMKSDTVSGRMSTNSSLVNEKLCDAGSTFEDKLQILILQEEKLIHGIKKINEKLNTLKCDTKAIG
eukprot:TRINITY_DN2048_c0_g1_i4.p1 TRINITY_DN2048_c0_g1~~TRINITY_DN2048_c0_g1_i4.p1  ORF type:complete len:238 (-),score=34.49 TRINITY_DN2048_c0_g1_i4:140-853(-)